MSNKETIKKKEDVKVDKQTKNVKQTPKPKTSKAKPKTNYKEKYNKLKEEADRLNLKIKELVFENNKNVDAFQDKAKGFQAKAQEEINKVKLDIRAKAELDEIEMKKYGAQKLLENILDPINNINVAIQAGVKQEDPGVQAYVQGFQMLMSQLETELEAYGLTSIEPSIGDDYNPKEHQAFSTVEGEKINTISQVKKKGYKLHERIIKPAIVVVVK